MTTISIQQFIGDMPFQTPMVDCFHDQSDLDFLIRHLKRKMRERWDSLNNNDQEKPFRVEFKEWSDILHDWVRTGLCDQLNFTLEI